MDTLTIHEIASIVADFYDLTVEAMKGKRRTHRIALARQQAMYWATRYTGASLEEIGAFFDRDHSTVVYARKQIDKRRTTEAQTRKHCRRIEARLDLLARQTLTGADSNE